jgi:eukaryotic-like serine/threonine-protein kinase
VVDVPPGKPSIAAASVAAAPVIAKASVIAAPVPLSEGTGSARPWKPVILVALLVGVLAGMFLLSPLADRGGSTAAQVTTHATAGARPTAPAKPTAPDTPKASEAPPATTPAPSSTMAVPAATANKQLENFVSAYYATVTSNRDTTWAQLSPTMQGAAGGRSGYDSWWKSIRRVTVQVQADAVAKTAVVHLTYTDINGRTTIETHPYTFLKSGGGYLIQTDR